MAVVQICSSATGDHHANGGVRGKEEKAKINHQTYEKRFNGNSSSKQWKTSRRKQEAKLSIIIGNIVFFTLKILRNSAFYPRI